MMVKLLTLPCNGDVEDAPSLEILYGLHLSVGILDELRKQESERT
jgi:hypothetical protein